VSHLTDLRTLDYSVLQQCIHCGLCLPSCPTYAETGHEKNSPRGRIALMRAVADGDLDLTRTFAEEMSYCLGCLACTTACPAGVDYATLFETARAHVEEQHVLDTPQRNFVRWFALRLLFTRPRLLRFAARLLWIYQVSGLEETVREFGLTRLLPKSIRDLEPQAPRIARHFSDDLIAEFETPRTVETQRTLRENERPLSNSYSVASSPSPCPLCPNQDAENHQPLRRSPRVALLTGCVQDLVFSDINRATADVLLANDCEVFTPRAQPCCGSLHAHNGDLATARLLARRQLDLIDPSAFDAIISNAGGCGSHLRHYGKLLADDPAYAPRADEWDRKLRDISEFLVEIGFRKPSAVSDQPSASTPIAPRPSPLTHTLTYHESCHLCHGQKVSKQPREILRALPGAELRECAEATWCCGSAGIYNLTQPATAAWLQQRKLGHLRATGAGIVATANPGCHVQIENGLRAAGDTTTRVAHPIVLLAEAYRAEGA